MNAIASCRPKKEVEGRIPWCKAPLKKSNYQKMIGRGDPWFCIKFYF